jgi:hypothetical protein
MQSTAVVRTPHAARYLGQLVKHFAHRLPAQMSDRGGRIEFPFGICTLNAGETLVLKVDAAPENLAKLENVVARHLERFSFREPDLAVHWMPAAA